MIRVPFTTRGFDNVIGMQFTLSWNREAYKYIGFEGGELNNWHSNETAVESGQLPLLWTEEGAQGRAWMKEVLLLT